VGKDNNGGCGNEELCSLSGIPLLYMGGGRGRDDDHAAADAKTIWGQVDMQNNALVPLLRRRVRKLAGHCGEEQDEDNVMHILCMGGGSNIEDKDRDDTSGEEDVLSFKRSEVI
jgi:hypothetical protein